MRFLLALGRANEVTTALGGCAALVVTDLVIGSRLLPVPFLEDAVEAGRVLPALFAACGALVVATDWGLHELVGRIPRATLVTARWAAGAGLSASALLAGVPLAGWAALYLGLATLATVVPRHWWLALPALLYLQLYLPPDLLPR